MKINTKRHTNLIDGGQDNWEKTDDFNRKVGEIKKDVLDKYKPVLSSQKNWFKRPILRFRIWLATKKRIDELSSWRNLHLRHGEKTT